MQLSPELLNRLRYATGTATVLLAGAALAGPLTPVKQTVNKTEVPKVAAETKTTPCTDTVRWKKLTDEEKKKLQSALAPEKATEPSCKAPKGEVKLKPNNLKMLEDNCPACGMG